MVIGYILQDLKDKQSCVACGKPLRSITLSNPAPGDIVMCAKCGEFMIFTKEMKLRKAEEADIMAADEETRNAVLRTRESVLEAKAKAKAERSARRKKKERGLG